MKRIVAIPVMLLVVGFMHYTPIIEPSSAASVATPVQGQLPDPVRGLPGLESLTFYELSTGLGTRQFTFTASGPELTQRRADPLGATNSDFIGSAPGAGGTPAEFYDVFYSDAGGAFNPDGRYITIECVHDCQVCTSLNIAQVNLNFTGGRVEHFNQVESFLALGSTAQPGTAARAVDGNLETFTALGNTAGQIRRLRLTLGFLPPEPPPGPGVVILDTEIGEGDSGTTDAVFRVGRNGPTDSAVSVDFTTVNFGAAAGSDYQSRTGTLTIPAGQQSANVIVPIIGDTMPERNQAFFVRLSNARGATITDSEAVGVILDDDDPEAITVCSTDTPKDTDSGPSLVNVDRDIIISDLQVRMFVENRSGAAKRVSASLVENNGFHTNFLNQLLVPNQSSIGTTCQPTPDFVISDGGAMRPDESEAPYVGQWRSAERVKGYGRNARGNWALRVGSERIRLNCWCLSVTGPREGLELEPARATEPVFKNLEDPSGDGDIGNHYVIAKIFANRDVFAGRVEDPFVTFRVRDSGGNVILVDSVLIEGVIEVSPSLVMTRVEFGYRNWFPGQHTIEAEIRGAGVVYTDIARVTWTNPCAATAAVQGAADADATLNGMRNFRDSKLAKSRRGREYARLYYKFSTEAVQMMLFNPMLVARSQEMIERYMPVVRDLASGKGATLTEGDLDEIDGFMSDFAAKGSPELQQTVKGLCQDLRDPQAHEELGITLTPGARRAMPAHNQLQSRKRAGEVTALFGLFLFGVFLVRWGRRKGLRTLLCMALALSVAGSQWPVAARSSTSASTSGNLPLASEAIQGQAEGRVLDYSTYLGGSGDDQGVAISADAKGNVYLVGLTDSTNLPTANAAQPTFGGGAQDTFVAKLDPSGTRLVYLTYLGGGGNDTATGLAVDAAGNAYLTGFTTSTNFPTVNALQPTNRGRFNGFVTKLGPTGNLVYSTYLGGAANDSGSGIAVDAAGNAYVAGIATSPNFPTVNALQPNLSGAADVYVAKLNAAGNQLMYSTYVGGGQEDAATGIAVDPAGNVYVTGATLSSDFRTANAAQASHGGGIFDGFVMKLNPAGTQLIYSTYLGGGNGDRGMRIAADAAGNAYVTGDTHSTNFPTRGAAQQAPGGSSDAFITKLNPSGALAYSTFLGGGGIDGGTAIAVDATGAAIVTGYTGSADFPAVAPWQQAFGGGAFDAFAAKLNPAGSALDYATWLGGSGLDTGYGIAAGASSRAYVMGPTNSIDFPVMNALQANHGGGVSDLFVGRLRPGPVISAASVKGAHLNVTGGGFEPGAVLLLGGAAQKTKYKSATALKGKKVGLRIAPGATVRLQVRNPDGVLSSEFSFTRAAQ